jgi:hypothetical protein
MSSGAQTMAIDGRPAIDPHCAAYYFDLAPVLERCEGMRRNPERMRLMCRNHIRLLAPAELMIPRDGGFYLVMQTRNGAAADALAKEISTALLELFFGTDCFAGIASLFRAVSHGEMVEAGVGVTARPAIHPVADDAGASLSSIPLRPMGHLASELKFGFLPMVNMQKEVPSIFLCGVVVRREGRLAFGPEALKGCDPKARPWVDIAALEYSLAFARQIVPTKFAAAICTSVSFETLAWSRGRQVYQNALRAADVADNPFVIVKIDDVPTGTPVSRLAEIVATVRPFVKRVFVRLPDSDIALTQGGYIGATGLCMALPPKASPPAIVRAATWLNRACAVQNAISCIEGADDEHAMPLLRAAGIRFVAGRADDRSIQRGLAPGNDIAAALHAA